MPRKSQNSSTKPNKINSQFSAKMWKIKTFLMKCHKTSKKRKKIIHFLKKRMKKLFPRWKIPFFSPPALQVAKLLPTMGSFIYTTDDGKEEEEKNSIFISTSAYFLLSQLYYHNKWFLNDPDEVLNEYIQSIPRATFFFPLSTHLGAFFSILSTIF